MAKSGTTSSFKDVEIDDTITLLDRWVKVFDRSKASGVPDDLPVPPGRKNNSLTIEDVKESVTAEVIPGKGRFSRCNHNHDHDDYSVTKKPKKWEMERQKQREKRQKEKEEEWERDRRKLSTINKMQKKDKASKRVKTKPPEETVGYIPSFSEPHNSTNRRLSNLLEDDNRKDKDQEKNEIKERPVSRRNSARSQLQKEQPEQFPPRVGRRSSTVGELISLETARALRELLMGSAYTSFNADWRKQHINFSSSTSYELSFNKPGPDGVMACLQALMLRYLLYEKEELVDDLQSLLKPSEAERQEAIVRALSHILWYAGGCKQATVVLPLSKECNWMLMKDYREDHLTELLHIFRFSDQVSLSAFLKRNLSHFSNTSGNGCILMLYSAVLSRSIQGVISDISDADPMLMGPHDSCTQSMINLMLVGRAVGNIFNGTLEVDVFGDLLKYPKKGVSERGEVGFLSVSEHLDVKHFEVGSRLKTPKFPVWVVDTGGRYSVVFCLRRDLVNDWKMERYFELHVYNGQSQMVNGNLKDVLLYVNTRETWIPELDPEEPTALENCLRTKWPGAIIEWEQSQ